MTIHTPRHYMIDTTLEPPAILNRHIILTMNSNKSYEYINEFLYFVLRHDESRSRNTFLYCSGINFDRFLPITKGRHRPMSNPAMRELQLVNVEIRSLVLSKGATPKAIRGNLCKGIVHARGLWYKEQLLIENVQESLPDEIIRFGVIHLLKKIDRAIILGADLPETFLMPDELQLFIENLCERYGS
jgi:hypothetical protein